MVARIIEGIPYEEYAKTPGINATLLKCAHSRSLAHCKALLDGQEDDSEAKSLGSSFHALLLEGRTDYVIQPETYPHAGDKAKDIKPGDPAPWNGNAKYCREWAKQQGGMTILTASQAKSLEGMAASARAAIIEAGCDLDGCQREVSVFAEKDGHPVKCRIDALPAEGAVIDLKKTRNAEPRAFLKQCIELDYHLQAAWILDVLRAAGDTRKEVWFVGVEDADPNVSCVLKFSDDPASFLRVGRVHCRAAFKRLAEAFRTNHWPHYGTHSAEEHAPTWMAAELEMTA